MSSLVDSSAWIEALRGHGRAEIKFRVESLLSSGTAAWCHMVRVELWHGVRGVDEKRRLHDLERWLPILPIDETVWERSVDLARRARAVGLTVKGPHLVITATALHHRVELVHADAHLERLLEIA